jgi:hypothetical protein
MTPVDLEGDSSGIQRYTHVLEEMYIRDSNYDDDRVLKSMNPPKPKTPKVMRAIRALAGRKWPENIIVKFGKRKHMAELLLGGQGASLASNGIQERIVRICALAGFVRNDSILAVLPRVLGQELHGVAPNTHFGQSLAAR